MWSLYYSSPKWSISKSSAWGVTSHDETWFKYPSAPLPLDTPLREVDIVPEGDIWTPNAEGVSASVNMVRSSLDNTTFTNVFRPKGFSVGGGVLEFFWYIGSTLGTYVTWEPNKINIELDLGKNVKILSNFVILPKAIMPTNGVVARMVRYGVRQMIYAASELVDFTVVLSCDWSPTGKPPNAEYFMTTRCSITRAKQTYEPTKLTSILRPYPLSIMPEEEGEHSQWELL
nr:MAG: hypothetical protein [Thassos sobemo-like virus]